MIANLDKMIGDSANRWGLNYNEFSALIYSEYDPKNWVSSAGARGPAQLMPSTAVSLGVVDIDDPAQNIDGGARYFRQLLDANNGDLQGALIQYKGIKDPNTPANQKILRNYSNWLKRKTREDVINAPAQVDPTTPTNLPATPNTGVESAGESSETNWMDVFKRFKKPQFAGLVFVIIMLFGAALFELSVKSAMPPTV